MLKEERYEKILDILEEEKYITAAALARRLYVSLPTIRRDLALLQQQNRIVRSHGGAKKIQSEQTVAPLDFRKALHSAAKRSICRAAADWVQDGDTVFIDASTTALHLPAFLAGKKAITVVTNGLPQALLLREKGIRTFCTGGELQESSQCCTGDFARDCIRQFNFDVMLFSSYGLRADGMIVDPSIPETAFRQAVMAQSKKTVFLCDKTKFFLSAPCNVAPLSGVDALITDAAVTDRLPEGAREKLLQTAENLR